MLKTAPASEPLSLSEVKIHLRVDGTEEDAYITSLITAARQYCENFQNRAYITQTWQYWLDDWAAGSEILIPKPPLRAVNSIKYYGEDGTEYILSADSYIVDTQSQPGRVVLKANNSWLGITLCPANGICIEFDAGYGTASDVPMTVRQAMLLLIGHWYEHREVVVVGSITKEIEFAVNALLWQDRVVSV